MSLTSRHLMPEGLAYAIDSIQRHHLVLSVKKESQEFYKALVTIRRKGLYSNIKAYIADVYILTMDDVSEILNTFPDINCIVVISSWDHYTDLAKQEARRNGVGVFTLTEFREALNFRGEEFLDTGSARKTEQTP